MIDLSKPVATRDGRPVRIICTNAKTLSASAIPAPIVALVSNPGGDGEYVCRYFADGSAIAAYSSKTTNLVNVPVVTHIYYNVWTLKGAAYYAYETEALARKGGDAKRPAGIVHVTLEDGVPVSSEILPA